MAKTNSNKKIAELKAGWLRTQADFDNYQKKTEADKANWTTASKEEALFEILPILDNLYFAVKHKPSELENNNWVAGLDHISNQIDAKLQEQGIERITPKTNEKFNPMFHEALETENKKGVSIGNISELVRPGYRVGDRVIRAAQVKVAN